MPRVYDFVDYRIFMAHWLKDKQQENPQFSLRAWALKLSMSPGFMTRVMQGHRNISSRVCLQIAQSCHLSKKETEYFELLVQYNQAASLEEQRHFFERLRGYKQSHIRQITSDQYEFYQKWYHTAILELLHLVRFDGDFAALSKLLIPKITIAEAKSSIALLERLGLIAVQEDKTYQPTDALISTGYDAHALAVYAFQQEMLRLAREGYFRFKPEQRSYSTLTLSVSEEDYRLILEELRAFRKRILQIAAQPSVSGKVFQFNFQVFPLSELIQREI